MNIRLLTATLLFGITLSISGQSLALDARADIDRAVTLISEQRYALARTYLAPALISPFISSAERSRAYYFRGFTFNAQNMPVSALKDFNRALEFEPVYPAALVALGRLHAAGRGVDRDPALAVQLYEQAADMGYTPGRFHMGYAYLMGEGVEKNLLKAREILTQAADQGHTFAMMSLAASYRKEHVATPDPEEARKWYERAYAAGEPKAMLALGYMLAEGEFGEVDAEGALARFHTAAQDGLAEAHAVLGWAYLTGKGTDIDEQTAFKHYKQGAEAGVVSAQLGLGHMLQFGVGSEKDVAAAKRWYEQAARAGMVDAQLRLANLLQQSDTKAERLGAAYWREMAAASGTPQAHNDYAWMLATSKIDSVRNGTLALDQAQKAVALEASAVYLDTLAAAYAEVGNFEQAVAVQEQALSALTDEQKDLRTELEQRLAQYQRSQPWRE